MRMYQCPSRFASAAPAAKSSPRTASSSPTRSSPRDGKFIEIIGQYAPRQGEQALNLKTDRVNYWLDNGAQPTDTVRSLLRKAGVLKARHETRLGRKLTAAAVPLSAKAEASDRGTAVTSSHAVGARTSPIRAADHRRAGSQSARHSRRSRRRADDRRAGRRIRRPAVVSSRARDRRSGAGSAPSCTSRRPSPSRAASSCTSTRSPTATSPRRGASGFCSCPPTSSSRSARTRSTSTISSACASSSSRASRSDRRRDLRAAAGTRRSTSRARRRSVMIPYDRIVTSVDRERASFASIRPMDCSMTDAGEHRRRGEAPARRRCA